MNLKRIFSPAGNFLTKEILLDMQLEKAEKF